MQKRVTLGLLILGAVIGITAVVIFILKPFGKFSGEQPPPLPESRPFQPTDLAPKPIQPTEIPPDTSDPVERERQAQEAIKRAAFEVSARAGTYSSVDGFAALRDVSNFVDADTQTKLAAQQKELARQYPTFGPSWGRSFRPLSSSITSGTPVLSSSRVVVEVQGQIIEERTNENPNVRNGKTTITFVKQGSGWVVSDIKEGELKL